MNVVLVMFRENGERRSFSLTRDVTVIGRREDADFRIPLSDVSRKHSRLIKDGDTLLIEDLGSANGTYLNGVRIQESEVHAGDTIQIGPIQFIVQIDGVPSEDELLGNTGGVSTHLANSNFATGATAGAAAMSGAAHEEELVSADDLQEIADIEPIESADALEEIVEDVPAAGEEEPVVIEDFVVDTTPTEDVVSEDAVEGFVEQETVDASDDLIAEGADIVAATDDIAAEVAAEAPVEAEAQPESFDGEPAEAPARPATPARPPTPVLSSTPTESPVDEDPTPLGETAEPLESFTEENDDVAPIDPDVIIEDDFVDIDTDSDAGEDDVLIDFGDFDPNQK